VLYAEVEADALNDDADRADAADAVNDAAGP
jgi:hypothetical protein